MGEIDSLAITMHEMFASYIRAGFTIEQAMELMKAHIMAEGGKG